ncbi:MAG: beta-carotene 15,15'-monooxygenase [Gammaproteobacteria bacterium]|nr:MAG: beta-carotene 15,15'-monooxygenase [Gammaproteobacteria bacterium]
MNYDTLIGELASQVWFHFALVAVFGFLTGLEFRSYLTQKNNETAGLSTRKFGSSRTFTFIAILGFVLYTLDASFHLFLAGMAALTLFFAVFYHHKLNAGQSGLLQPLISLIVYAYGPVAVLMPAWFLVLVFVSVVFTLSARSLNQQLIKALEPGEITTLAKFLLVSGVILPLLPNHAISSWIPASPFKIWMAVVVISAISYAGYILKKYVLKRQGYLVTGLLGGLYSSTAATVVLARKSHDLPNPDPAIEAGILAASGMMYLRLLVLIAIMNANLLPRAALPMLLFSAIAIGGAVFLDRKTGKSDDISPDLGRSNPLELGIALLFALLFVVMMVITQQVISRFGDTGLNILSFGVGFTDIDPFVLSILSGHYAVATTQQLVSAIIIAAGSNDLLKALYALTLGGRRSSGRVSLMLLALGLLTIAWGLLF